jgi:hypothetical protein
VLIKNLWQLKTVVFLHWCLTWLKEDPANLAELREEGDGPVGNILKLFFCAADSIEK